MNMPKGRWYKAVNVALIAALAAWLLVLATPSPALAMSMPISEPSFETVANWTYFENDVNYNGAQSTAWKTQGTYSYLFSVSAANIGNTKYAHVSQTVDLTSVDTLSFDLNGYSSLANKIHAHVMVAGAEIWTLTLPTTATDYLHQEIDLSGYTGSQSLAFGLECHAAAVSETINLYYDNIKLWGSYNNSARTTRANSFTGSATTAYMDGHNFDTTGTYKVVYYDGGTLHAGADGAQIKIDTYTDDADGILDGSQVTFTSYPTSSYGTWHAVVFKTTGSVPASYNLVSKGDATYVVQDSFTVDATAIPEFSTIAAAVGVAGMSAGIYIWMRKRRLANVRS